VAGAQGVGHTRHAEEGHKPGVVCGCVWVCVGVWVGVWVCSVLVGGGAAGTGEGSPDGTT
jgi:hypothetical protein